MKLPRIPWRRVLNWRVFPWVLAAILLGTTLTNWWLLRSERREDARVESVRATAETFLHSLTTFSAKTIDQDVQRLRSFAVGDFAQQVQQTFSPARIKQIKQAKVNSTGTIRSLFVEDVNGENATVFAVVDERVTNASSQSPRTDVLRVELVMINTASGWKVSNVNILQNPGETGP